MTLRPLDRCCLQDLRKPARPASQLEGQQSPSSAACLRIAPSHCSSVMCSARASGIGGPTKPPVIPRGGSGSPRPNFRRSFPQLTASSLRKPLLRQTAQEHERRSATGPDRGAARPALSDVVGGVRGAGDVVVVEDPVAPVLHVDPIASRARSTRSCRTRGSGWRSPSRRRSRGSCAPTCSGSRRRPRARRSRPMLRTAAVGAGRASSA